MFQTLQVLAHPAPNSRLEAAEYWLMINHALAAFTQERRRGGGESISASEQRAKLTVCSSVSTSSSRCFHPSGGCLCGMHFVFSQQQLHLHSDFDTFSATSALFFNLPRWLCVCHSQISQRVWNANVRLFVTTPVWSDVLFHQTRMWPNWVRRRVDAQDKVSARADFRESNKSNTFPQDCFFFLSNLTAVKQSESDVLLLWFNASFTLAQLPPPSVSLVGLQSNHVLLQTATGKIRFNCNKINIHLRAQIFRTNTLVALSWLVCAGWGRGGHQHCNMNCCFLLAAYWELSP